MSYCIATLMLDVVVDANLGQHAHLIVGHGQGRVTRRDRIPVERPVERPIRARERRIRAVSDEVIQRSIQGDHWCWLSSQHAGLDHRVGVRVDRVTKEIN